MSFPFSSVVLSILNDFADLLVFTEKVGAQNLAVI